MSGQLRVVLIAGVLCASILTVYTQYVFLHTTDDVTTRGFRELSIEQYRQTLEGTRPFPYQWRVAGPWLVRLGESLTAIDPHLVDAGLKSAALAVSAFFFIRFAARSLSAMAVVAATALYFVMTAAGYSSEGYSIYYTNDFLMVAGWNAAVALAAAGQWPAVALVVFLTVWAKETVLLIVALAVLGWRRGQATFAQVALCAAAFAIPFAVLRAYYPAPLGEWAWWHNLPMNLTSPRDTAKLILFFNVWGWLAFRALRHGGPSLARDLGYVAIAYVAIMYVVIDLRELRHFLPLLIVVLPPAVGELERLLEAGGRAGS